VRRLAAGAAVVSRWGSIDLPPEEYKPLLEDRQLDAPAPSASASASAAPSYAASGAPSGSPSAKPSATPSSKPKAPEPPPPPPAKAPKQPVKVPDPSVVRKSRGGLLLVMKPDAERGLVEVGRVALPADAWGLGVSPDGRRAVVTSAWPGIVSVVDVNDKKVIASLPVAREPRGVTVTRDGKTAYVSHLVGAELTRIDDLDGAPKAAAQPLPAGRWRVPEKVVTSASLGWSVVMSPDQERVIVPRHAIGAGGAGAWWGAPVVDVLDRTTGQPLAPPRYPGSPAFTLSQQESGPAWVSGVGKTPEPLTEMTDPRAVVYRKKTGSLIVAAEGRSMLVELDATMPEPTMVEREVYQIAVHDRLGGYAVRGGAPSSLALAEDEDTLYVFCRTTYDLARIDLAKHRQEWLRLADDWLPEEASKGRRLYAEAGSSLLSDDVACETCHPEGRDDGHVWREVVLDADKGDDDATFVGLQSNMPRLASPADPEPKHRFYPRQTPMIAGRVRAKGPYGWHAEADSLVERLQRGFQLHRAPWRFSRTDAKSWRIALLINELADYVRGGLLPPPTESHAMTDQEKRGKAIFESPEAQCSKCHVPDTEFTDRTAYPLKGLPLAPGFDAEHNNGFKTPSLWFVARTAPYFHDGSQATLEDLVKNNGSRMGQTSHLGPEDQAALVAYLRTL
jgi:YVTN family beta-propeller protein